MSSSRTMVANLVVACCLSRAAHAQGLLEARAGHETTLEQQAKESYEPETPPDELFTLIEYETALGPMAAYLSTHEGKDPRPAILWLIGGIPGCVLSDTPWRYAPRDNDQSARAYRDHGVVMMFPSPRGRGQNPGVIESFYGEVDDVLSAIAHLQQLDYVDPDAIYLGGHSTGGTLALLIAAATDELAGVIAFGPTTDPCRYGQDDMTIKCSNKVERRLRAPIHFLNSIRIPTFVIEGEYGNTSLRLLDEASKNPKLSFIEVPGADHFDVLAPVNDLIAQRIVKGKLKLTQRDATRAFQAMQTATRESFDLEVLARLRYDGHDFRNSQSVAHFLGSADEDAIAAAAKEAKAHDFDSSIEKGGTEAKPYYSLTLTKRIRLKDLKSVFETSKAVQQIEKEHDLHYSGWDLE